MLDQPGDPRALSRQGVEVWAPLPDLPYEASNLGRVRSKASGQFVGTHVNAQGYRCLSGDLVHRLILTAFDGPQPARVVGRHLADGDRGDNALHNLAWGTRRENADDTARHGRLRSRSGRVAYQPRAALDAVIDRVVGGELSHLEAAALAERSISWVYFQRRKRDKPDNNQMCSPYSPEAARELARSGEEVWVLAVGPGDLEVSNLGRCRTAGAMKALNPSLNKPTGYVRVLGAEVHRVVLRSFEAAPGEGFIVRHGPDHDRSNNRLDNLSWGTYADNGRDTVAQGRSKRGEKHGRAKVTDAEVEEALRRHVDEKWTTAQLGMHLGIGQGNAANLVNGKTWQHVPRPENFGERKNIGRGTHHSHLDDETLVAAFVLAAEFNWGAGRFAEHLGIAVPTATQIYAGMTWPQVPRPQVLLDQIAVRAARLTDTQLVEGLRKAKLESWGAVRLGRHLGVSTAAASALLANKSYKHVLRTADMAGAK